MLSRDRYYFNGTAKEEDSGSLEIVFSDSTFLTLSLASDGGSVNAMNTALTIPEAFELNDGSRCSWEREILSNMSPWSALQNSYFESVDAIIEYWHNPSDHVVINGWVLRFDTGDFITYWNNGDDSVIAFNKLPPLIKQVETRVETIVKKSNAK